MRHDAFEPGHVPLAVAGEFSVVVVVRGEMLMNGRMRVVCVRVVPMLLGQCRRDGKARHHARENHRRPY
jgi:hypothetical protein